MQIMTVLGPIPPDELGLTSMHEHILCDGGVYRRRYERFIPDPAPVSRHESIGLTNIGVLSRAFYLIDDNISLDDEQIMQAEVEDFKRSGGSAMVEMSAPGLRSNLQAIQRISQATGVRVIATTGLYVEDSWPGAFLEMSVDELCAHMQKEIREGIEDTGIRAGHMKLGITDLSLRQERALRAAARVSQETNASLTVHPGFGIGSDGRRILRILTEEGMNPERVILAHTGGFFVELELRRLVRDPTTWGLRLDYAREVLASGATICIDCFGHRWDHELNGVVMDSDWQRMAGLVALIEEGYSEQIVLGNDVFIKMLARRYGGLGYCRLTDFVIPTLRDLSVSEYDIRRMLVVNPARLLAM